MKRNKTSLIAASAVVAAAWAVPQQAHAASMIVDMFIHGATNATGFNTNNRSVTGLAVGSVVTIDMVGGVAGDDADPTNDWFNAAQFSIKSSTGGLLVKTGTSGITKNGVTFNNWTQTATNVSDYDGDGDVDFGWGDNSHDNGYMAPQTINSLADYLANTAPGNLLGTKVIGGVNYNFVWIGSVKYTVSAQTLPSSPAGTTIKPSIYRDGSTSQGFPTTEKAWFDQVNDLDANPNPVLTSMYGTDSRLVLGAGVTLSGPSGPSGPTVSLTSAATLTPNGTVTLTTSGAGSYQLVSVADPSPDVASDSVSISDIGNEAGTFIGAIKLSGGDGNLAALAAAIQTNSPGWTVTANPGAIAGIPGTWDLKLTIANPTGAGANDKFNIDLSSTTWKIDQVAAIPEPSTLGLAGLGAVLAAARRKRRA